MKKDNHMKAPPLLRKKKKKELYPLHPPDNNNEHNWREKRSLFKFSFNESLEE